MMHGQKNIKLFTSCFQQIYINEGAACLHQTLWL